MLIPTSALLVDSLSCETSVAVVMTVAIGFTIERACRELASGNRAIVARASFGSILVATLDPCAWWHVCKGPVRHLGLVSNFC